MHRGKGWPTAPRFEKRDFDEASLRGWIWNSLGFHWKALVLDFPYFVLSQGLLLLAIPPEPVATRAAETMREALC